MIGDDCVSADEEPDDIVLRQLRSGLTQLGLVVAAISSLWTRITRWRQTNSDTLARSALLRQCCCRNYCE